ncbi:MAG: DegV family protein [Chloroflexota bacterium]|nr:MAG: DegV family protein [Chloroflexota bacterium]
MIIVTDSAADLPRDEVEELGVVVAPLHIQFSDGSVSAEEITPDQFYSRLKAMEPEIPTTSQPSAGMFAELYEKFSGFKDEILSIHISSGLSGTIQSARLGARQAAQASVHFFDTMTLSGGERFHVRFAACAAKAGWTREAILDRLEKIRAATEVVYTLETLTYLARGGRIGRVQALAGSILKIKPVITVDKSDGRYSTVGKERTIQKALESIREHLVGVYGHEKPMWVSVLHGQFADQARQLAILLEEKMNIAKLEVLRISPVLGVHTGPGIVGAAAVPMELMEGVE